MRNPNKPHRAYHSKIRRKRGREAIDALRKLYPSGNEDEALIDAFADMVHSAGLFKISEALRIGAMHYQTELHFESRALDEIKRRAREMQTPTPDPLEEHADG